MLGNSTYAKGYCPSVTTFLTKKTIFLDVRPKEWKVSSVAPIPKAIEVIVN
jgi:hypothetical protein